MSASRARDRASLHSGTAAGAWPPIPGLARLAAGDRVHLIGVGGAGMSGLARALAERGMVVSGSDRASSPELDALRRDGIAVAVGHADANLPAECRLVVRSPAVPEDNAEIAAARAAGIPVTKRAVLLGALMDETKGIAVAGTHGKTTTTGLVAAILVAAGLDPSYFVGGSVPDLPACAHIGAGEHLVIEADEYDRSFHHGHPSVAVITSVEHDHPDIYPTLDDVTASFGTFVALIRPDGRLIYNAGSAAAVDLAAASPAEALGYHVAGEPASPGAPAPAWRAAPLASDATGQSFEAWSDLGSLGHWRIRLPGRHNVGNALAAIAVGETLGIDVDTIRETLAAYRGAARRFEEIGHAAGVVVVDDYAHHPTEIAATIQAARERYPTRRIWAVWQPHTYSRVAALRDEFAAALRGADRVAITPVYAAREDPLPGADPALVAREIDGALQVGSPAAAGVEVAARAEPDDVLLFMGAGDITRASGDAVAALRERDAAKLLSAARDAGLGGEVMAREPLARHTSLRVGGPADVCVRVREQEDLGGWWLLAHRLAVPVRVLGRGTNVLVGDGGCQGLVILNRARLWRLERLDGEARVVAGSGVSLATLARSLARQGWAGLEAAAGIPGTVGGAVATNAGAYGWCMADSLIGAEVLAADGSTATLDAGDLEMGYRTSTLKGDSARLLLRVVLRARPGDADGLANLMRENAAHRSRTQPASASAGSIFRNPPGDYAGRLIEAAGLKGATAGGMAISAVHANFLVNRGGARAADAAALIRLARRSVLDRFGVRLELEIEPVGENGVD